jgi:NADH-quinone oxidoreductase subunit J
MRTNLLIPIGILTLIATIAGTIIWGIFGFFAAIAIGAGLGMLASQNAIHSALFFVLNFACIAAIYVILNAPFIAMVQITVYAGAIMVLFLFVIMLLGAEQLQGVSGEINWQRIIAIVLVLIVLFVFGLVFFRGDAVPSNAVAAIDTSPTELGLRLFEGYILPFELTGVLLLASMIGVVILNKNRGE